MLKQILQRTIFLSLHFSLGDLNQSDDLKYHLHINNSQICI